MSSHSSSGAYRFRLIAALVTAAAGASCGGVAGLAVALHERAHRSLSVAPITPGVGLGRGSANGEGHGTRRPPLDYGAKGQEQWEPAEMERRSALELTQADHANVQRLVD